MFKRFGIVLFLLLVLLFTTGCGKKEDKTNESPKDKGFTITWQNDDGAVLEVDTDLIEGDTPVYDGNTPTKSTGNDYSLYVFKGWSPTIGQVNKNQTYQAVYELVMDTYEITWKDAEGNNLDITTVKHGDLPRYVLPKDTEEWDYVGWDKEVVIATTDTTYHVVRKKQVYEVSFNSNGGSEVISVSTEYKTLVNKPAEPTKENHRFLGWYTDETLASEVVFPFEVKSNQTFYAAWNEQVPYLDYLNQLLTTYQVNPYSFVPNRLLPGANIKQENTLDLTYESNTNLGLVPFGGYGEQWQMVLENLNQATLFFNAFSSVEVIATSSVVAFHNYLDSNPDDEANYEFKQGIYTVNISIDGETVSYNLAYQTNLFGFGEVRVEIELNYDTLNKTKEGRIQAGEPNALKYKVDESNFEMAIKYGGIRRSYLELNRMDDVVEGKIVEYLGLDGQFSTNSSAMFFIDSSHVQVVGNKSSSMIGWSGTIVELYQISDGSLIGYEVRETISSITYNTLWFNLTDTTGITSIRKEVAPIENANKHLIYVNNQSTVFKTKTFGGFTLKNLSRRYDVEFRTQYFYYLDMNNELKSKSVLIPMLFIQQEKRTELLTDVMKENSYLLTFNLNVTEANQNNIITAYETLVDPFILQKDEITVSVIIEYIGK